MGQFLEYELPTFMTLIVPIGIFVGMYYTFERAMRESGGTKAGYIILGIILLYLGVSSLKDSLIDIKRLF